MWAKIITIKRTKDLNYFSLCAFNLFNTQVSQFELNYWKKNNFSTIFKFIEMHLYKLTTCILTLRSKINTCIRSSFLVNIIKHPGQYNAPQSGLLTQVDFISFRLLNCGLKALCFLLVLSSAFISKQNNASHLSKGLSCLQCPLSGRHSHSTLCSVARCFEASLSLAPSPPASEAHIWTQKHWTPSKAPGQKRTFTLWAGTWDMLQTANIKMCLSIKATQGT